MEKSSEKTWVMEFCRTGLPDGSIEVFWKDEVLFVYSYGARLLFKLTDEDIRVNAENNHLIPILEALAKREGKRLIVTKKTLKKVGRGPERVQFWQWENPIDADDSILVTTSALADEPLRRQARDEPTQVGYNVERSPNTIYRDAEFAITDEPF